MQAIILLAGYGSRLARDDIPHKSLLPFGDDTLLSRHLRILQDLGLEKTVLVVGHNRDAVKDYVGGLDLTLPIEFVDNPDYLTTGNTLSLILGLRGREGDLLVMDGDVLYPREVLEKYVTNCKPPSFAIVPVDIDDTEATKVLLDDTGYIHSFVTKRDLTDEEKARYKCAGEALGFFLLTPELTRRLIALCDARPDDFLSTLWEIPFSEVAPGAQIQPFFIVTDGCMEIDTQEDYDQALSQHRENPEIY
ncbi:phosphocholine cytidylyltransferase family protein [Nitrospina gracilis]|uniref:phosphocholine cytidylyltransferase family protein n=1 Tax=Nitrospina gracilis TaxID=35801 RepID=UPI001F413F2D|nr:NTP transferase domain-containing protein [Nitrospina gracilis]MCF8721968.1 choline kinase [Nitrospina gracilis Nb-211]